MISRTPSQPSSSAPSGRVTSQLTPSRIPQFFRPEVHEVGTQTQPGLLAEHQLPPNKRSWSRAFGQESATTGVPLHMQTRRLMPVPQQSQSTQVPGVAGVAVVHPAMPNTVHYLPDVPGQQTVSGPTGFLRQRRF